MHLFSLLALGGLLLACAIGARADVQPDAPPFGDALTFQVALRQAEQHAPDLAAQSANIGKARAAAIPAAALPDPRLVLGASNVPISGADRFALDSDPMTMGKISVMQEIPNGDKREARADIAAATVAKADAEHAIERLKVRQAVAGAWLNRFYLERRLAVLADVDRENALLTEAVHVQLRSGRGKAADALIPAREDIELADRRDELQQAIAQATAELRRWIGDDAALPLGGSPPVLSFDPVQLHLRILRHPELAAYGPMTELAEAEVREAEAGKKSDWGVELEYQRRGAPFDDMVSLNFTFDLPVFSGSRQEPRIEAKRQALIQLAAERQALMRERTAGLDSDLARFSALRKQIARLQQTRLPLAQQEVDVQMAGYRAGQSDLSAVLAARRELIETRLRGIDLEGQLALLTAKLFFAWEETAP